MSANSKKYSQNFLRSETLVTNLLQTSGILKTNPELILEIGPGKGIITDQILNLRTDNIKIIGIEIDPDLTATLQDKYKNKTDIEIVNEDFLTYKRLNHSFTVISNLPFAFTSDILRKILNPKSNMNSALLIIQKEAAEMIMGIPQSNLKSLTAYPYWEFKMIKSLQKTDYKPEPSVDTVALLVTRRKSPLVLAEKYKEYEKFIRMISKDRVGEGVWKRLFSKNQRYKLIKKTGLVKGRGIAMQKAQSVVELFNKVDKG